MKNFISNEKFVHKFFLEALEEKHMLCNMLVILSLVKGYGHKLNMSAGYLQNISKQYPDIAKLYEVLHMLGKTNIKDLNDIINFCKKIYRQQNKEFTIISDVTTHEALTQYIHKNFENAEISMGKASVLGIDIKGEGYRYHRNIDNDLDIILGR